MNLFKKPEQNRVNDFIDAAINKDSLKVRNTYANRSSDGIEDGAITSFNKVVEDLTIAKESLEEAGAVEAANFLKENVKAHTGVKLD